MVVVFQCVSKTSIIRYTPVFDNIAVDNVFRSHIINFWKFRIFHFKFNNFLLGENVLFLCVPFLLFERLYYVPCMFILFLTYIWLISISAFELLSSRVQFPFQIPSTSVLFARWTYHSDLLVKLSQSSWVILFSLNVCVIYNFSL